MTEQNGNVKVRTVLAVVSACTIAISVMVFLWWMDAARCAEIADIKSRVGQQDVSIRYMQATLDEIRGDVKAIRAKVGP